MPSPKMKPRASTETFASSIATSLPLRKTLLIAAPLDSSGTWLLQPQSECIPGASENTRFRHRLQSEQGILADRLAVERDAQHADALVLRERRDQGLLRHQLGFDLVRLALGHGHQQVALHADLHRLGRAFPDLERLHLFAALEEPHAVEELVAPVEQLERLLGAGRFRGGTQQHREQAPVAASR